MKPHHPIRLAVLDMAGTTVADGGLVIQAFEEATSIVGHDEIVLSDNGTPAPEVARQFALDTMGQPKIVVFREIFGDEDRAQLANRVFEDSYDRLIQEGRAEPIPGAVESIRALRGAGIKVVLTTGFSRATKDRLLAALDWHEIADLTLAPSDAGRGRPYPDLVLTAALRLEIDDVKQIAVLGDTASDIATGLSAGAQIVAGTLTGAHSADELTAAGATHIVSNVSDFAALLLSR